ncbi:MAG: DUF551 domain-containing protein [Prevotellaceae bacterium]|jgi:hypothetical protein|nr:DUF551 domain-containing protein [Prevotellaceae bacterium]
MKTVKEAAREYIDPSHSGGTDYMTRAQERAYIAGVEFAQRWISVEEELPEFLEVVLVRNKNGFASAGRRGRARFIIDLSDMRDEEVTHWRHIELK